MLRNDENSESESQIYRRYVGVVWLVVTAYVIFYYFLGAYFAALVLLLGVVVLSPLTLWLDKISWTSTSRFFFLLSCNYYIYGTSAAFGHKIGGEFYYLPAAMIPLLLRFKKKELIAIGLLLPLMGGVATFLLGADLYPNSWIIQKAPFHILEIINFIGALAIAMIFVRIFVIAQTQMRVSLEQSNIRRRLLMKNASDGIHVLDENGVVVEASDSFSEMLGYKPEEVIGMKVTQWDAKWDPHVLMSEIFPIVLTNNKTEAFVTRHRTKQGNIFDVEVTTSTLNVGNQKFVYCSSRDITKRLQEEAELRLAQSQLIQTSKMASLGEMAAGIAHEINNPLAIIDGSTKLLLKDSQEDEKNQDRLKTIEKATARITKIITGLRKFSRNTNNKERHLVDLNSIIQEVETLTSSKANRHNVKLIFELNTPAPILCDEVEMEQVFVNLINNAVDAVKNSSEKWVVIKTSRKEDSIVIHVIDSGHGILSPVRENLFNPFFTTKKVGEGTGLGLSIAKGIIEAHGGSISLLTNTTNTCFEINMKLHSEKGGTSV